MKIKINTSPIYNIMAFLIVCETGLFELFNIPLSRNYSIFLLAECAVIVALYANCFFNRSINKMMMPYFHYINFYVILLILFLVIHVFYGMIHYDQDFRDMFSCLKYFICILAVAPLTFLFVKQNGYKPLLDFASTVATIYLSLQLMAATIYNFFGVLIFPAMGTNTRYGRLRIGMCVLGGLTLAYMFQRFLDSKGWQHKWKYALSIGIILIFEVYTNMTRMYLIAFALMLLVMFLFMKRKIDNQIIAWFLVLALLTVLLLTGTLQDLIASFSETSEETGSSTIVRRVAIQYFSGYTDDNPFLGMGFVNPDTLSMKYIFFGPELVCCFDDIGIINMWYHYGITGVILAGAFFVRLFYIYLRLMLTPAFNNKIFFTGILTYIIATQASLSIFDGQRIFLIPIVWAMFEYEYYVHIRSKARKRKIIKLTNKNKHKPVAI